MGKRFRNCDAEAADFIRKCEAVGELNLEETAVALELILECPIGLGESTLKVELVGEGMLELELLGDSMFTVLPAVVVVVEKLFQCRGCLSFGETEEALLSSREMTGNWKSGSMMSFYQEAWTQVVEIAKSSELLRADIIPNSQLLPRVIWRGPSIRSEGRVPRSRGNMVERV